MVLDPARPYGFFYFAPGRWRLVYRPNRGEDRGALTTEAAATELLLSKLPEARVEGCFSGPAPSGWDRDRARLTAEAGGFWRGTRRTRWARPPGRA
jgi:hypothetical protein